MTHTEPLALLRDTEHYLSALHGSVARHDNLAANYGCAGCELRDRIAAALPEITAAVSAAVAPPTNRAALRDRIAAAIWERQNPGRRYADCEYRWQADAEADADAVLALLPTTDRASALREAADAVFALDYDDLVSEQDDENLGSMREAWDLGTIHASQLLRRMADETATETPETPTVAWHILTHQRGTWRPWLAPRDNSTEAREDYDRCVSDNGHRWAFRLVRETSTFTVESEHQPAAGARQDGAES